MELGLDRRSTLRINAIGTVILTLDGETFEGVPLDVSGGGARVRLNPGPARRLPWPGARLKLDFIRRLGRPAFSVDCVVVRVPDDGRDFSLKFEVSGLASARLRKFLELEAAELGIPAWNLGEVPVSHPGSPTPTRPIETPAATPYALLGWLVAAGAAGVAVALILN